MHRHAERLRRIKQLCDQLDAALNDAHAFQGQRASELRDEARKLAAEIRRARRPATTPPRSASGDKTKRR